MAPGISDDGLKVNEIKKLVEGFREALIAMQLAQLVADGLVEVSKGPRGSKMHKAVRPAESVESVEQVSDQLEL